MKTKKVFVSILAVLGILAIGFYIAVPIIARGVITKQLLVNPANTFGDIEISWGGPQIISDLHIEDALGTGDVEVTIHNSLFSLALGNMPIEVVVTGDATVHTAATDRIAVDTDSTDAKADESNKASESNPVSIPAVHATISLDSLTITGDEAIVLHEVQTEIDVDPGMHFVASIVASTGTDGSIDISLNAPSLVSQNGLLNVNTSATCRYSFVNTPIPSIQGFGGWSIVKLGGEISSPNLQESVSIRMGGTLAEYDISRGEIWVKAQLLQVDKNAEPFVFNYNQIDGVASLTGVPTSILSPLISISDIRINRDIGPVVDIHVQQNKEDSTIGFSVETEHIFASGHYSSENDALREITLRADLHSELVNTLTVGELTGTGKAILNIDQYVLGGTSKDDRPECSGKFSFNGKLLHVPSQTHIEHMQTDFLATMRTGTIGASGSASLNGIDSAFEITLSSSTKNKVHSVEDLWKTITKRLPKGIGQLSVSGVPSSVLRGFLTEKQFEHVKHFGNPLSANVALTTTGFIVSCNSPTSKASGNIEILGSEIVGIKGAEIRVKLNKQSASDLFDITFNAPSTLFATVATADMVGNSAFALTYDVGKQHMYLEGKTIKQKSGALDLHVATTGVDTKLLDALCKSNGLLADSLGTPLAAEVIATNILDEPTLQIGGNSPNAIFETVLNIRDGVISTAKETPTTVELLLSSELTQHLLKDLGPVLSDIRSVSQPIQMTILNASSSLDNDVSKLQATVQIDIGEVELDSGSITMRILPMFNSTHVDSIPATFDPIHMEITNGVIRYKEFHLTLDNKYSIPYSGAINLVNRKLHLQSAVPLTGLGYSIKELRGLATDIDVPILITGTIDKPIAKVDPNFDLGKLLQSAALSSLGDAIGGLLGDNQKDEAPNPLDLLDELFGD